MNKTKLQIVALTDRGMERDHNEDYHAYVPNLSNGESVFYDSRKIDSLSDIGALLIVADGMGGTNAGEVASKIAVDSTKAFVLKKTAGLKSITQSECKNILLDAVNKAQSDIVNHQKEVPETSGMGTTLVLTWMLKNQAYIVWVGDSRCYGFNQKDGLFQLSKDHSYVQELVDAGKITEEQAFYHPQSNIITQSLGDHKRPPIAGFVSYNIQAGDSILICSDGLNGMVTESKMEMIMKTNSNPESCTKSLLDEANIAGGHDNITVLLASIENVDLPLPNNKPQKKVIISDDSRKNEPLKQKNRLSLGIIIGIVLAFIIMFGIKYIPNISKDKVVIKDSLYSKEHDVKADSSRLKKTNVRDNDKKEDKSIQIKLENQAKYKTHNTEPKTIKKAVQKDSTTKKKEVTATPIKN